MLDATALPAFDALGRAAGLFAAALVDLAVLFGAFGLAAARFFATGFAFPAGADFLADVGAFLAEDFFRSGVFRAEAFFRVRFGLDAAFFAAARAGFFFATLPLAFEAALRAIVLLAISSPKPSDTEKTHFAKRRRSIRTGPPPHKDYPGAR
ncbi:MAG: hypothetical protein RID42_11900 [Alphaproteobacteria bacterium]